MRGAIAVAWWVTSAFAAVCLAAAALLGIYTATWASRPPCDGEDCLALVAASNRWGWTVALTAAVAVVVAAAALALGERGGARLRMIVQAVAVAAAIWLIYTYRDSGFSRLRDQLCPLLPSSQQSAIVAPAVVLAVTGLLALAISLIIARQRPLRWLGAAVGLVAAVALAGTVVLPPLEHQADADAVSAATAPAAEIPPFPTQLGQQRFDVTWPAQRYPLNSFPQPAGTGFVALLDLGEFGDVPTVVGYDASGQQRWHYSRTGSMRIDRFRAYADGSVVIADASSREAVLLIGLDAVTGAVLWQSNDPVLHDVFGINQLTGSNSWYGHPHLVLRGEQTWTGFDPRTGRPAWTIPSPLRCADGRGPNTEHTTYGDAVGEHGGGDIGSRRAEYVDSADVLVTLFDCSSDDRLDLRQISVAPSTGELLSDTPVPLTVQQSPGGQRPDDWHAYPAGADGYELTVYLRADTQLQKTLFVDSLSGRTVTIEDGPTDFDDFVFVHTGPDGGFVVRDGATVRVFTGAGEEQCSFTLPDTSTGDPLLDAIAVLGDEIVYSVRDPASSPVLRVVQRSNCRELTTLPAPTTRFDLVPVHGATLLRQSVSEHGTESVVAIGYA